MGYLTFKNLGEHGRLGNQLYQYAALKGIAKKKGLEPKIPDLSGKNWHGQRCLLNEFRISCAPLTPTDTPVRRIEEPYPVGYYHKSFEDTIPDGVDIVGFFQNTQYFSNIEDEIKQELLPKQQYLDDAKAYIESIREGREVVSVHVRRGDMTDGTNPNNGLFGEDPIDQRYTWGAYFDRVTDRLFQDKKPEDYLFLVFVGGSRSGDDTTDIEWAKRHFDYDGFHVSDSNDPMVDFSRMLCCDTNIVSQVSSFGWWTAYLNPNPDKKVFAPFDYHLDNTTQHRSGFYPESWILV